MTRRVGVQGPERHVWPGLVDVKGSSGNIAAASNRRGHAQTEAPEGQRARQGQVHLVQCVRSCVWLDPGDGEAAAGGCMLLMI